MKGEKFWLEEWSQKAPGAEGGLTRASLVPPLAFPELWQSEEKESKSSPVWRHRGTAGGAERGTRKARLSPEIHRAICLKIREDSLCLWVFGKSPYCIATCFFLSFYYCIINPSYSFSLVLYPFKFNWKSELTSWESLIIQIIELKSLWFTFKHYE